MTFTKPRRCKCCGEWWLPLPGDTSSICLRCNLEFLKAYVEHKQDKPAIEPKALSETNL